MTTRVFTVEVTGCSNCPHSDDYRCNHDSVIATQWDGSYKLTVENKEAIIESCPMYQHSFVKDEKK